MKGPADFSGAHIVRANVTGRRSFALADTGALDEKILIHDARGRCDDERFADVAAEAGRKVDPSGIAEVGSRSTGGRVE